MNSIAVIYENKSALVNITVTENNSGGSLRPSGGSGSRGGGGGGGGVAVEQKFLLA